MKNLTKKIIVLLISVFVISIGSLSTASASTSTGRLDRDVKITIKQGRYNSSSSKSIPTYVAGSYNDLFNVMEESVGKIEDTVKVVLQNGYLKNDKEGFLENLEKVLSIVGTGSYVDSYTIYTSVENGNFVYEIKYNYPKGIADARKKDSQVNSSVSSIISKIINPSMNPYEKEKAIHDYIVNNTRYDTENYIKDTVPLESHTAYGVFGQKVAVCDGYASAMKKMLDAVGIENKIIVGDGLGEPHAWNLVKLYGTWHHVDSTWDDPIVKVNGKYEDVLTYDYFNKSDRFMEKTHTWIKSDYPKADSENLSVKKGKRFMSDRYL